MPQVIVHSDLIEARFLQGSVLGTRGRDPATGRFVSLLDDKAEIIKDYLVGKIHQASRGRLDESFVEVDFIHDGRGLVVLIRPDNLPGGHWSPFFLRKADKEGWVTNALALAFGRAG